MYDFGWQIDGKNGMVIPKKLVGPQHHLQCDVKSEKNLFTRRLSKNQYVCKQPRLQIHQEDDGNGENETSTLNLDKKISEISHEFEFIYFGESDDDDGDNLSDLGYDDCI